jgi:hypothetical protein
MATDTIIAEVRQAREELAKRFNYDLRAMIQDARKRQVAGGRKVVAFPPKPVRKTPSTRLPKERMQAAGVAEVDSCRKS